MLDIGPMTGKYRQERLSGCEVLTCPTNEQITKRGTPGVLKQELRCGLVGDFGPNCHDGGDLGGARWCGIRTARCCVSLNARPLTHITVSDVGTGMRGGDRTGQRLVIDTNTHR